MRKKGISLIVLIVTIVVIIVIATAIIVTLTKTNIIKNANIAQIKNDFKSLQTELNVFNADKYADTLGSFAPNSLYADEYHVTYIHDTDESIPENNIYDILPSLEKSKYKGKVEIKKGILCFISTETQAIEAAREAVGNIIIKDKQSDLLSSKIELWQIIDTQRFPAIPVVGSNIELFSFTYPYKKNGDQISSITSDHYFRFTNLGTISTVYDEGLKESLQEAYPGKDYDVVRLDEFGSNDEFIESFSQAGILYLLDEENGLYIFIASRYGSVNSFGYLICLSRDYYNAHFSDTSITLPVQAIVQNIN